MGELVDVKVPDIGDFKDVPIIEVMVKPGSMVSVDDPLVTLESDKATMDVPAPQAGVVKELRVKVGDKVSEGSLILRLERGATVSAGEAPTPAATAPAPAVNSPAPPAAPVATAPAAVVTQPPKGGSVSAPAPTAKPYASPGVRRLARELDVAIGQVTGSGPKGRILKEDVERLAGASAGGAPEQPIAGAAGGVGLELLPWPKVDFAKFGPIETQPLSRIKKISGANLARNWIRIPHVTQFDEADVTELEAFRKEVNDAQAKQGVRVTMLAFILKACAAALRRFPEFNASLDGDNLVLKKYFHIGFAADTPAGLVVPVLRDADSKGVLQIAREMGELSAMAREGKLKPTDMQGGCFTVSSLGGIGGSAFTPIINAPEVAILGVSRMVYRPVYRDGAFVPRLILPLSLSYDHRVVDGAAAARFTTHLAALLADMRRTLL